MYFLYLAASFLAISWLFAGAIQIINKTPWWQKLGYAFRVVGEGALFYFLYTLVENFQQAITIVFSIFRMMGVPI
jgi:hypothetical protein